MNLSCGGSSGGEGALLALRASPLGVGTDIGKPPAEASHDRFRNDINKFMEAVLSEYPLRSVERSL